MDEPEVSFIVRFFALEDVAADRFVATFAQATRRRDRAEEGRFVVAFKPSGAADIEALRAFAASVPQATPSLCVSVFTVLACAGENLDSHMVSVPAALTELAADIGSTIDLNLTFVFDG